MKAYTLTFITLATILLYTEYVGAYEICPKENCLSFYKCQEKVRFSDLSGCDEPNDVCCSIVKPEFRTLCRHHGGICMDTCNAALKQESTDCQNNEVCCVLV